MPAFTGDQWRDATALNPPSVPIATNWAWAKATVAKTGITDTVKACVQAAEGAIHVIECVKCPCFTAA